MPSIAFTGNRDYSDRAALYRGLDDLKADRYYFGGARGADTDALEYISKTQPLSERIVVVPNRLEDQPATAQAVIRDHASFVIELKNEGPGRFQARNMYMVDRADQVVAFTDGRESGGTYNTIQYAKSQGKAVEIINYYDFDVNEIYDMTEEELVEWIDECRNREITMSTVKGLVIDSMKKFTRSSWTKILAALHTLPR